MNNANYEKVFEEVRNSNLIQDSVDVDKKRNRVLLYAVRNNNVRIVKLLLKYGADATTNDNIALSYAVRNNNAEIVELLLEAGADATADDNMALLNIVYENDIRIKKLLLDMLEAGIYELADDTFTRAVCRILIGNNEEMLELLLKAGADVASNGNIASLDAMHSQKLDIVKVLLLSGSYVIADDNNQMAELNNKAKIVKLLLQNEFDKRICKK